MHYVIFQDLSYGIIIFNLDGRFESNDQKCGKNSQRNFGQCSRFLILFFLIIFDLSNQFNKYLACIKNKNM